MNCHEHMYSLLGKEVYVSGLAGRGIRISCVVCAKPAVDLLHHLLILPGVDALHTSQRLELRRECHPCAMC